MCLLHIERLFALCAQCRHRPLPAIEVIAAVNCLFINRCPAKSVPLPPRPQVNKVGWCVGGLNLQPYVPYARPWAVCVRDGV